jgi:uncharacterized caspase-like protein
MRACAAILLTIVALCACSRAALAEKRIALVIGNSAYENVAGLANPVHDAAAISGMFQKAGFDVVESRNDLKNVDMRRALRDFTDKAQGADIAVIYYAGHGIEVNGVNYLIPVDAALERDTDAYDEAISLDRVMQAIEPAKHLHLVILDACRNNPFLKKMTRAVASRSLDRGLIGVEPNGQNTLIAYAAKAGFTAMDGDGQNSPFALALLKHLTTPGLDIRRSLGQVRDDVLSATDNRQEPYYTGSLGGDDMTLVPAPPAPSAAKTADMRGDYELAERVGTRDAWDSFITAYPAGFYSDLAKAQRNKLAADVARQAATDRAHATAEAQTRLAAEGAKAGEQAKAAAEAKAAEDARLAAEQKKQAEDTRLAQAQQLKAAAQAKADEQVKALAAGEKPRDTVIAALPPAVQAAPPSSAPDPSIIRDLPRLLQSELKRVGCNAGEVSGEWNGASRQALGAFNKNAGTHFDIKLASLDALDAVRGKTGRVCPPPERQHAEHAPAHKSSGGKCFSFEGSRVCQ